MVLRGLEKLWLCSPTCSHLIKGFTTTSMAVLLVPAASYAALPAPSYLIRAPVKASLTSTLSRPGSAASLEVEARLRGSTSTLSWPQAEVRSRLRVELVPRARTVVRTPGVRTEVRPFNNFVHPEEPRGGRQHNGHQRWRPISREATQKGWASAHQLYGHDDWWRSSLSNAASGNDRRARARHHGTYDARVEAGGVSQLEPVSEPALRSETVGYGGPPLRRTRSDLAAANSFHPIATKRLHEHRYGTYDQRDLSVLQLRAHEYGLSAAGTFRTLEKRVLEHEAGLDRAPNEFRGRGHNW